MARNVNRTAWARGARTLAEALRSGTAQGRGATYVEIAKAADAGGLSEAALNDLSVAVQEALGVDVLMLEYTAGEVATGEPAEGLRPFEDNVVAAHKALARLTIARFGGR